MIYFLIFCNIEPFKEGLNIACCKNLQDINDSLKIVLL
jgi:hypothetical protein